MSTAFRASAVVAVALLGGCPASPETPEHFEPGAEVECAAPTAGWGRFSEEAEARGLDITLAGAWTGSRFEGDAGVVAQDLDADGDQDLAFGQVVGPPVTFLNDGAASFLPGPLVPPAPGTQGLAGAAALSAVDLDGDGLPELLKVDQDRLHVWPNLGGGSYGDPASHPIPTEAWPSALAVGDADGDGRVDVVVTTSLNGPGSNLSPQQFLYLGDGEGALTAWGGLPRAVSSMLALFSDRDLDGDQDLLVGDNAFGSGGGPTIFYRNDGDGVAFVDDAADVNADLRMAAMGVDSLDLNGDGLLDYCITDVGPPRCLISDPLGFVDSIDQGLEPVAPPPGSDGTLTVGWSLDFADLDNDGWPDAVQTGAPDHGSADVVGTERWPDLAWRGLPDGQFAEITDDIGFGDDDGHFGLATADFDADGSLDIIVVGPGLPPRLFLNSCGAAAWLELELVGPQHNRDGLGAIAWVEDSRGVQMRELYGPRAYGQTPSRFHFGLGEDEAAERVVVRWPDGVESALNEVDARQVMTVRHPDAD